MSKYTLVRESYWVGNGCDCCDDTDVGIVYIEDEDGNRLTFTANDGCSDYQIDRGFSGELNALLYLVNEVLDVEVETEDRSDYGD